MRSFLILFLLFSTFQFSFGQDQKSKDTDPVTLDVEIEKVISDPYYLMLLEDSDNIELKKSDLNKLDKKWVSTIDIWTEDEKKKEYGYEGNRALVLITLKKKRIDDFLALIKKSK